MGGGLIGSIESSLPFPRTFEELRVLDGTAMDALALALALILIFWFVLGVGGILLDSGGCVLGYMGTIYIVSIL